MIRTSEELRADIERQKAELKVLIEKENKTAPVVRETVKNVNIAVSTAMYALTENGLSEQEAKEVLHATMDKMGFGIQTVPEKKQTVKPRKSTGRKTHYGPTPKAKVMGLNVPTPESCLQAAVILLADKYGMTGRQLKQFVEDCGKKESLALARAKFNKYDPTGKLWQKQCITAVPYVNRYGMAISKHYAHIK